VEVLAAVHAARAEAGVVVDALAAHGGPPSGQDAAVSASIIFWMGLAAAPPTTMATAIALSVMTVLSHTILVTRSGYPPATRAAHPPPPGGRRNRPAR